MVKKPEEIEALWQLRESNERNHRRWRHGGRALALAISRLSHGALPVHLIERPRQSHMRIRALMDELLRWRGYLSATGAHRRLAISG